ncbi:hypothetical protein CALCODRAFT_501514 [Calocera cornea HHB12733]|uniref:Uncharacterized protein n=1 Tax=Calocera cornea HHB12733 TaxID=1353952 RepID=A0A165DLR0_9BASI|nr:hypothetical protein CALCODRAFT_501514 [Calocera cornea HHB12733]
MAISNQFIDFGQRWTEAAPGSERQLLDSIADTKNEIERVRADLKRQEARLQSELQCQEARLFAARATRAPISRLSDDILTIIFEANAESMLQPPVARTKRNEGNPAAFQLVCSQVCHRWRQVAFRTSSLWSSFLMEDRRSVDFALIMLKGLSCRFGLVLRLYCSASQKRHPLIRRLLDGVTPYIMQLIALRLQMCKHAVYRFATNIKVALPSLIEVHHEQLHFTCSHHDESAMEWIGEGLHASSELLRLRFSNMQLPSSFLSMPTVVRLHLYQVGCRSSKHLLSFLSSMPNLQELILHDVSDWHRDTGDLTEEAACLDDLRTLRLSHDISAFQPLFSTFVFPKLQHLSIEDVTIPMQHVVAFVQHNNQSITHCNLHWSSDRDYSMEEGISKFLDMMGAAHSPDGPHFPSLVEIRLYDLRPGRWSKTHERCIQHFSRSLASLVENRVSSGCSLRRLIAYPALEPEHHALIKDKVLVGYRKSKYLAGLYAPLIWYDSETE